MLNDFFTKHCIGICILHFSIIRDSSLSDNERTSFPSAKTVLNSSIAVSTSSSVASLLNDRVYAIPMVFIVGWRGEPGIHDEPQHIYQGEVTVKLLEDMDIKTFIVGKETTDEEVMGGTGIL